MPTTAPKFRREHLTEFIKNEACAFFARNTTGQSMITVTNVFVTEDLKNADVFISVLPDSKKDAALNFAKRMRTDLQKFILKDVKLRHIPFLEIVYDEGEKLRDKINAIVK